MNGLKYIRTRCNLSLSELADMIGVSRQALSSWENGKKDIPEQRSDQLAEFFGIGKEYFGEISEKEKEELLWKAMFRYYDHGKETYRYRPPEGITNHENTRAFFMGEREKSLDEEYALAQRKKEEVLKKAEELIIWTDNAGSILSQIACINRGCDVYSMINSMLEKMRAMKMYIKMPFFFELISVWKAMLLAYGLMDKNEMASEKSKDHEREDKEWILQLSEQIKSHWEKEAAREEKRQQEVMNSIKKGKASGQPKAQEVKSIEAQIADAETKMREFAENLEEGSSIKGAVFSGE